MLAEGSRTLFQRCPGTLDRKRLRAFHNRLEKEVAEGRSFNCLLTDDRRLRQLNSDFLQHDYATDVLSFPSGDDDAGGLGEVAISIERAIVQATEYGHGVEDEVEILMLHGALHLMGMDHETDRGRMARAETRWRRRLGLPVSLIARSKRKRS